MEHSQPGIFNAISPYHFHCEYKFLEMPSSSSIRSFIGNTLACVQDLNVDVLFGFNDRLWERVSSAKAPGSYRCFEAIQGTKAEVPSTQSDLWIWLQGDSHDSNFDVAVDLNHQLENLGAERVLEIKGFARHENRDFTGFIDGTENPDGEDALDAVMIPSAAGSCFAFTQQWIHDLDKFHSLSESEQEKIIGRTKPDSIELDGDAMPQDSHVSRTDAEVDGVKQKILRRSVPYGNLSARGLHFVSFACDLNRIQVQLERMYCVSDDGLYDRLTDFSTPVSGSFWYVPSQKHIFDIAES